MNSDVRDILELEKPPTKGRGKGKNKFKRLHEPIKRPVGVNREVWGLIRKDDMDINNAPLMPIQDEQQKYTQPKAKLRYGVRKWKWTAFKNPARTDNAAFHHWRYDDKNENNNDYQFAKYNKKVHVTEYTDTEYNQYLEDENWSKDDTDYLFDLCKTYDLRFYVIFDRWNVELHKSRTIDELKDRYYKIIGILQKLKQAQESTSVATEIFVFDLEHEQKRREQLNKLYNRTIEQINEEEYLLEELKKIEIRKRERERKSQNLTQLLSNAETNEASVTQTTNKQMLLTQQHHNSGAGIKQPKIKSRKNSLNDSNNSTSLNSSLEAQLKDQKNLKKSLIFKATVESAGIKFPETKTAGASLRSYKMKLPPSVGLKKTKAIEQLLEKLQLEQRPIATDTICEQFNEIRSDIVLLYELNQAISNYEFELQSLKHRYEALNPGKLASDIIIVDNIQTPSTSSLQSLIETPTPQKQRTSDTLDVSATPTTPLERRRKAALNSVNVLKKLRGRGASISSS